MYLMEYHMAANCLERQSILTDYDSYLEHPADGSVDIFRDCNLSNTKKMYKLLGGTRAWN